MSWWGKVVGGTLGFMMMGPLGAILGASIGHNFDRGLNGLNQDRGWGAGPGDQERVQTAFFTATFSVIGAIAKADGHVSKEEIRLVQSVMQQINLFNQGKQSGFPLEDILEQFRQETHRRRNLVRMFIEIQIQAAYADGSIHPAERKMLLHICARLGFSVQEYESLEAMIGAQRHYAGGVSAGPSLEDAYAMLNIDAEVSDAEMKKAYRRLLSQHHPDKLVSKGLPDEMIKIATEKTHEIRRAYEQICEARGLKH